MPQYSEQDLKYATELREEIHREALAIVRKTRPYVTEIIDRHPVEDYLQDHWDYPGKLYTMVSIPYGCDSRKALIDAIVRDTLTGKAPKTESDCTQELQDMAKSEPKKAQKRKGSFSLLLAEYPDLVVEYRIIKCGTGYSGYQSHRKALKAAFQELGKGWNGDPDLAIGQSISTEKLFSPDIQDGNLNYRKAFLDPPQKNHYTDKDFDRVNSVLFPNGTYELELYEWTTDWSEYFDDGHEWWGTLCITVYDPSLDRFVVIMASATD